MSLYIHIPFCRSKCRYCSFTSYARREADIPTYLKALKRELKQRAGDSLRSLYFGGGTPSLLKAGQLGDLLENVASLFNVERGAEITMEANPGTVDKAYLAAIRRLGINRLSLGVQSLNDRELKLLGRIHTAEEAAEAVKMAREAGLDNLNMDLIYGLPGQTLDQWRETLGEAVRMAPEHLSLYGLSLEEGTPLERDIQNKLLPALDPDTSADQYELAEDLLTAQGYSHYEISNWAKAGRESRHNLGYWQSQPYIGIGVAAHSFIGGHRTANTSDLDKYLAAFANDSQLLPEMDEMLSPQIELAETVILGLRLGEGIDTDKIGQKFGVNLLSRYRPQIGEMAEAGLLERTGGRLKLTRRGRLLSNEVFWRFLPG